MAEKRISSIPEIPQGIDPKLHRMLSAVKEALEVRLGRRGDPLEEAITKRDLLDAGIAKRSGMNGDKLLRADVTEADVVKTPPKGSLPPAPEAFMAEGVFGGVVLSWQHPLEYYDGHSLTEIWRSTKPDPTTRTLIASAPGSMYFDQIASPDEVDYYYWIRFVSGSGRFGPFSPAVKATKPEDVGELLDRLSGEINESILAQGLRERIDLIDAGAEVPGSLANIAARIEGSFGTLLETERVTRSSADSALASQITTVAAKTDSNTSAIQTEQTARASADSALASQITTVAAKTDSNTAAIQAEQTARTSADSALASQITTVAAEVNTNTAAIRAEQTARASADSALASQITTLQTSVNGNTAAIQTQATVVNGLSAQYMVKLDVNGYVSGYGLYNSGGTSQFLIHADRFAIGRPGVTARYPFIVDNGQVVIDTAVIRDGSIQQGKIGPISFGKITDASGNPVTAVGGKLKAQYIESDGVVTGYLNANTSFIRSAHIQNGAIDTAKIGDLAVDTLKIAGNAVTVPLFAQGGAMPGLAYNTFIECCSVSGYFNNSTFLQFSGQLFINNAGEGGHIELQVRLNGNPIGTRKFFAMWFVNSSHSFFGGVYMPAGNGRFSLHARTVEWDASWLAVAGSALSVMGVKR